MGVVVTILNHIFFGVAVNALGFVVLFVHNNGELIKFILFLDKFYV